MCNLYRMSSSRAEVAEFFGAIAAGLTVAPGNAPEEIYPGYPALVMTGRELRQMTWGFPLVRKGAKGQPLRPRPINNARTDKLVGPFWSASFSLRRCLIPVSEFAEAEGPKGGKTRTWLSLPDQDLFAVAGFWRDTAEWGAAFTMVMTDACPHVRDLHDRMPVIVPRDHWTRYLGPDVQAAFELCRPYDGQMALRPTDEPWAGTGQVSR